MRLYQKDPEEERRRERRREEAPPPEVKPLTVWNLISIGFRRYYDELGKMVLTNVYWSLIAILLLLLPGWLLLALGPGVGILGGVLLLLLVGGPSVAGIYSVSMGALLYQDPSASSFFRGMVKVYRPAVVLAGMLLLFSGACLFNLYICVVEMMPERPGLGQALAVIFFWLLTFFGMFHLYPMAFLVQQECGPWTAIKRGMLVALARPLVSFVLLLLEILIVFLTVYLTRGLFMLIFGATLLAFLGSTAVACMLEEYKE